MEDNAESQSTPFLATNNDTDITSAESTDRLRNLATPTFSSNLDLRFLPRQNISEMERKAYVQRISEVNPSELPTKVLERPRKTAFYWVKGHNMMHGFLQTLVVLSLIIVPILLVQLYVYPSIQNEGNLPFYDCA